MINEPAIASATLTVATTVVCAKPALLYGVILNPAAVSATVTVYDNATAGSGSVLVLLQATGVATTTGASTLFQLNSPVFCKNGLTAVVTGVGGTAQLYYTQAN